MITITNRIATSDAGLKIRRRGTDTLCSKILCGSADTPDDFEEVAPATLPPYTEAEYAAEVNDLIRCRYSLSDELAVQRKRDIAPEEFAAYFAYCEECKQQARARLANRNNHDTDNSLNTPIQ